jgi:PPOX class probable F420-dependent enzyme
MKLSADEARARLAAHDHGVLSTRYPEGGVHSIPVVFAVDDEGRIGMPIDRVKPKATMQLQRRSNLEVDPRGTLLVQHWDADDWSKLWWARAELELIPEASDELRAAFSRLLAARYQQYRDEPFDRILVFRVTRFSGWDAGDFYGS